MPDAALPDTTVLTSSFWDPYVREQLMTTCTSSTRPSPVAGRFIFETDTKLTLVYDGSAWVPIAGPVPWTGVTFTNGWVNYGGAYQPVQYRKIGDMVQVRGSMKSGTLDTVAFTLPAGFRPIADTTALCPSPSGTHGLCFALIATSGTVVPSGHLGGSNAAVEFPDIFQFSTT